MSADMQNWEVAGPAANIPGAKTIMEYTGLSEEWAAGVVMFAVALAVFLVGFRNSGGSGATAAAAATGKKRASRSPARSRKSADVAVEEEEEGEFHLPSADTQMGNFFFSLLGLLADAASGYVAWAVFVQLPNIMFFYPCVHLGFTGLESFSIPLYALPALMFFGRFSNFARANLGFGAGAGQALAHWGAVLCGLMHFWLHEDPYFAAKLMMAELAIGFELVALFSLWCTAPSWRLQRSVFGLALGLALYQISTLYALSMSPALLFGGANLLICGLAGLAACWHMFENRWWAQLGLADAQQRKIELEEAQAEKARNSKSKSKKTSLYPWARPGIGLAGTWSVLENYFAGHGIVSRHTEMPPFPHGLLVVAAVLAGVLLMQRSSLIRSPRWFFMGAFASFCFIGGQNQNPDMPYGLWSWLLPSWVEFAGGIFVCVYATSIMMPVWERFAAVPGWRRKGYATMTAIGTYYFFAAWSIYPPSYKFMDPVMGVIWRERSISMLYAMILACGVGHIGANDGKLGQFWADLTATTPSPAGKKKQPSGGSDKPLPSSVWAAVLLITWVVLFPVAAYRARVDQTPAGLLAELPSRPLVYQQRDMMAGRAPIPADIRALGTAIHFGYSNHGGNSAPELVRVIREAKANVVGLVECDNSRRFLGNRDFIEYLGAELGYHTEYGPSTAQNTWGCALLSVFPIVRADRIVLPSPEGELACLVDADIDVNGTLVQVLITHVGNTEDELDVKLQHEELRGIVRSGQGHYHPTMIISYLTGAPWEPHYTEMLKAGIWDTTSELNRYCFYILYRDMEFRAFERIDKGDVSDTEQQVGQFRLLADRGHAYRNLPDGVSATDHCRQFHNDTVACQARRQVCGWCQRLSWGSCFEPEQMDSCLAIGGTWIGAEPAGAPDKRPDAASESEMERFAKLAVQQNNQGRHPVSTSGTVEEFTIVGLRHEIYVHERQQWHSVPVFRKVDGGYASFIFYYRIRDDAADNERAIASRLNCTTPSGDFCTWGECGVCTCPEGASLEFCERGVTSPDYRSFDICAVVAGGTYSQAPAALSVPGLAGQGELTFQPGADDQCAINLGWSVDDALALADKTPDNSITLRFEFRK